MVAARRAGSFVTPLSSRPRILSTEAESPARRLSSSHFSAAARNDDRAAAEMWRSSKRKTTKRSDGDAGSTPDGGAFDEAATEFDGAFRAPAGVGARRSPVKAVI